MINYLKNNFKELTLILLILLLGLSTFAYIHFNLNYSPLFLIVLFLINMYFFF